MASPSDITPEYTNGSHDNDNDNDNDDHSEDGNSDVTTIPDDEYPSYFIERNGRLFHSHPRAPYPLPVDTPEQDRLDKIHDLLHQFFGSHNIGPLVEMLENDSPRQKFALDVCTATGRWTLAMSEEFPHVEFRAFDIVPITTRYPPDNVKFEVHDLNEPFRWDDGTFDVVNARNISMTATNYHNIVQEIIRVLRPGGLFISYEWTSFPPIDPERLDENPSTYAPASALLHRAVRNALHDLKGIIPTDSQIPDILRSTGAFSQVYSEQHFIPIGDWPPDPRLRAVGELCYEANKMYADAVETLLIDHLGSEADVNRLLDRYRHELTTIQNDELYHLLYTVYASKA